MKFLTNLFKKKNQAQNYYVGLFFKESELEAFLYEAGSTALTTISHKSRPYTSGWDKITEDTDDLLFAIEQETQKKFEKTILLLHSHFIDPVSKQIRDLYNKSIKGLLKQLDLKPLGFIECYEAVVAHLQKRDHTLLNAILIELDNAKISTYLYMGGRQVYQSSFDKTTSLAHHLNEEFGKMKKDSMLPSRLVIYGEHDYPKEVEEVCAHQFEAGHFIQMPKVELFSKEDLARAFSDTFEEQIMHDPEDISGDTAMPVLPHQESVSDPRPAKLAVPDENFEVVHTQSPVENKKEVMGFVIGDDVGETGQTAQPMQSAAPENNLSNATSPNKTRALSDIAGVAKTKIVSFGKKVKEIIPANGNKAPYIAAGGVLVLLLGIFALEYFFHRSEVVVFFPSQELEKNLSIPAVLGDNQINLKIGTVSAQVTGKKVTSGKRDVGEKAKGEVTIHNFEDKDRVFTKGTILKADNHSFILDQEVKVASASEVLISGGYVKQPGKAKGAIIASEIGIDSNLEKNKKFQVADFSTSTYFGINEAALAGGTKKEIKTVAKADIDDLRKQAVTKGSKQAEEDLKKVQSSKDEQVLGALTEAAPKKLDFSKEVGEEAGEVTLTADIGVTYYTYSSTEMKNYLKKVLQPEIRDGFALPPEKLVYRVKDAETEGDEVTLEVDVQAEAVRKFSREEIIKKIAGKNQKQVESILKNELKATSFEVKTNKTPVFFLSGRMPMSKKNIVLKIDSL